MLGGSNEAAARLPAPLLRGLATRTNATRALIAAPAALLAGLGWKHRWTADDAFIDFRVVDNLVHGFGPVFNHGERVEAYTSPAWVAILSFLHGLLGLPLEWTAVVLGIGLAAAGLACASYASLLLARAAGRTGVALPAGALIVVALRPMWDFASSGLETGLGFGWMGATFLALVTAYRAREAGELVARSRAARVARSPWALALLAGLGPLIRPDFGIFSVGFLVLVVVVCRPPRRRTGAAWIAAGLALPVAYQVFRMGYFAALVPNTALAKEAGRSDWSRGLAYLRNFVSPYALWIPLLLAAALLADLSRWAWAGGLKRLAAVVLVTVGCGLLHALYVVRVGGDFMHGRLLLPGLFGLLMPVMAFVPRAGARWAYAAAAAAIGWSLVCAAALHLPRDHPLKERRFQDERAFYVAQVGNPHPVTLTDYAHTEWPAGARILRGLPSGTLAANAIRGRLNQYLGPEHPYPLLPLRPGVPQRVVAGEFTIGAAGYAAGRDVRVVDRLGLADPVASRLEFRPIRTFTGVWPVRYRAGHEKRLPAEWVIGRYADFTSPAVTRLAAAEPAIAAAHRALGCGDLRRLLSAVDRPLTPGRFLSNIGTAWELRSLRLPPEPKRAATELCGPPG